MEFTPNDFDEASIASFPLLVQSKRNNRVFKVLNPSEIPMDESLMVIQTNFTGEVDVQTVQATQQQNSS